MIYLLNLINNYLNNLDVKTINDFFISKDIYLNEDELNNIMNFIKKNPNIMEHLNDFNIDDYHNQFTKENFSKIKSLYHETLIKYQHYL